MRVPWMARSSNQSILKEISPGCSLEGLILKMKLQYFGHLMRRADSFEKTLMLGKIRDLFKKIRDTKRTFHAKMDTIKHRNCMDLTEAEDIKKRWQEHTEELYKKIFMTQIITMV